MTTLVANKLTPQREAMNLYRHGTVEWKFTPNVVLTTAKRDIQNREFNSWVRGERAQRKLRGMETKTLPATRRFGFLEKHVHKAVDAAALLKLALEDRDAGRCSDAVNTLALYDNVDALAKAYALACEAGA